VLGGDPKSRQAVRAEMIGRRIDQCCDKAQVMEMRDRTHERVTRQLARTTLVVEVKMTAAADK
jgi:hypothetical protein